MPGRLHGDYFIMASPSFDTATNRWAAQADVSWNHKSSCRKFAFIRFPNRFRTEAEAIAFALEKTPTWIDKHTRQLESHGAVSERPKIIDVIASLKKSIGRATPYKARQARPQGNKPRKTIRFEPLK